MAFTVLRLLALALAQQYVEGATAAVTTLGAVHGHHRRQLWQPGADIAFQQGARRAALSLAVQDQQAADVAQFAIRNELHQALARFVQGLLVQIQARLQLVLAEPQLLVDPLLHPVALEADDGVGVEHLDRFHAEVIQGELFGGGGLAPRQLGVGRAAGRLEADMVVANGAHIGHFIAKQ